jgi:hypothetical protein
VKGNAWSVVKDWSTSSAATWTPTEALPYTIEVDVRHQGGTAPGWDSYVRSSYQVTQ